MAAAGPVVEMVTPTLICANADGATAATDQVASLREAIEAVLAAVQADIAAVPETGAAARKPEPADA